jgi:hypothetical protein
MTIVSATPGGSGDPYAPLVASLEVEFENGEVGALAGRILKGEKAEFHWMRASREWRIAGRNAILIFLAGRWYAEICLVGSSGCAVDLLWLSSFHARVDLAEAFARAR